MIGLHYIWAWSHIEQSVVCFNCKIEVIIPIELYTAKLQFWIEFIFTHSSFYQVLKWQKYTCIAGAGWRLNTPPKVQKQIQKLSPCFGLFWNITVGMGVYLLLLQINGLGAVSTH